MNEASKERITQWLRAAPSLRGALVRGVRFADETFVTDGDAREFPASALESAWRMVADTFHVLQAQHLPARRLTWVHERTTLHCARHANGAILGVFLTRKSTDADPVALEKLLVEFEGLVDG